MYCTTSRSLIGTMLLGFFAVAPLAAETIVKMDLGASSPDVLFDLDSGTGTLHTQSDGNPSPGDTQTNATFLNFVSDSGVTNISADASLTIADVEAKGSALVFGGSLVNQETTGGTFALYDQNESLILEGELQDGILTGPLGSSSAPGPSTGSLFTVNLGKFVLSTGADDSIYNLLDPDSAQLSMSFTNVASVSGATGFTVESGVLQSFTADVTAQIEADPRDPILAPEPASFGLVMIGAIAILGLRRRR